jgi:N-acyl amino acid synthase FeeM
VVEESEAGSPPDEFFDFRPLLAPETRFSSGSMLCVDRAHRDTPRLVFALLAMGYHWSRSRGLDRMVGAVNPDVAHFFARVGGRKVAPRTWHEELGVGAIPILVELDRLPVAFARFLTRQRAAPFPESFERELLECGESLDCGRDVRHAAYAVLDGRVAFDAPARVAELGPGEWLSELDLTPAERRALRITALSAAELMLVDAEAAGEARRRRLGSTGRR